MELPISGVEAIALISNVITSAAIVGGFIGLALVLFTGKK